jgi:predicted amidophosphoribosyltransferase
MKENRWKPLALNRCWTCSEPLSLREPICPCCREIFSKGPMGPRHLWNHQGPVRELIRLWRNNQLPHFSLSLLLRTIDLWRRDIALPPFDAVLSMPQRNSFALKELSSSLAALWKLTDLSGSLIKTSNRNQHGKSYEDRWAAGLFLQCTVDLKGYNHILLVDDVETSGVTLLQGERALKLRGAPSVTTLALAKQMVPRIEGEEDHSEKEVDEEPALWFHLAV